jgi:hypothetical protein
VQGGGQVRRRVLDDREEAEQDAGHEGRRQREGEDDGVEADLVQARQVRRLQGHEQPEEAVSEAEAEDAAEQAQRHALQQQLARDPSASGAERHAHGELLLPPLHAHQQEVRHVRAGDEQHEADRAHQHPEHVADVAHEVLLEGPQAGGDVRVLEQLLAVPGRGGEALEGDGKQPRHVRVRLGDRRSRLETRDRLVAEVAEEDLGPVELEGEIELGLHVEEAERAGHHPDDLVSLAVDDEPPADRPGIAAQPRLPVRVAQDDGGWAPRLVVLGRERPAQERGHAEQREDAVRDAKDRHALRLGQSGHAGRAVGPEPHVLERPALVTRGEVEGRTGAQVDDVDAGGDVPDPDQLLGVGVGERLEEHAVQDAEYRGVGADGDGHRCDGHRREQRGPREPADEVLRLGGEVHGSGYARGLIRVRKNCAVRPNTHARAVYAV